MPLDTSSLEPFALTDFLDGEEPTPLGAAVDRRIVRGFYEAEPTLDVARWLARSNQQRSMRVIGFQETGPAPLPGEEGPRPVATLAAWDGLVTLGDQSLRSRLITGVGVAPTHRRRGLLRQMMTRELTEAQAAGCALASLTVSEGLIYGRFGFGMCTRAAAYQLRMQPPVAFREGVLSRSGAEQMTLHEVAPSALVGQDGQRGIAEAVQARVAATRSGQVHRFPGYAENMLGLVQIGENTTEPDRTRQAVLCQGPDGPEGYVVFRHRGWTGQEASVLEIKDFQAATPAAEVALWRFLTSLDLVDRIEFDAVPGGELRQVLTDPRALRTTMEKDMVWNRILDVTAVLEARDYRASGELVVEVSDAMGLVDGAYHLAVAGGVGQVLGRAPRGDRSLAPEAPRAEFTADLLATAVFRGCQTEARLGAVGGDGAALAAELLAVVREPYCDVNF